MKHKRIEHLIQKSLDCEINLQEQHILDEHLATCPECQHLYEAMKGLQDGLSMLVEWYPRTGFNARVMHALDAASRAIWKKLSLVIGGVWAVSIGALLLLPVSDILNKIMTSIPSLIRVVSTIQVTINTIGHVLAPLTKVTINPFIPVLGVCISIGMFIIISKALHKEEQCKA